METSTDPVILAVIANMLKVRFSLCQVAAALGVSLAEAMKLIGKAGQDCR